MDAITTSVTLDPAALRLYLRRGSFIARIGLARREQGLSGRAPARYLYLDAITAIKKAAPLSVSEDAFGLMLKMMCFRLTDDGEFVADVE